MSLHTDFQLNITSVPMIYTSPIEHKDLLYTSQNQA